MGVFQINSVVSIKALWLLLMALVLSLSACSKQTTDSPSMSQAPDPAPVAIEAPPPTASVSAPTRSSTAPNSQGKVNNSVTAEAPVVAAAESVAPMQPTTKPNIIYNPPKEMTLGTAERVEIRITNEDLALEELTKGLIGKGDVITDVIETANVMEVKLCCGDSSKGDPFDIVALNPLEQKVAKGPFTQWAFRVTPRQKGPQNLNLTVTVFEPDEFGSKVAVTRPVKTEEILINVDRSMQFQDFVAANWHWLSLLLVLPLIAWYVVRNINAKRRRKSISGNESVFISYRRDDSSGYTLAIYQKLKDILGDENVFMDRDDIPHGVDFSEHLEKVLSSASTVLVMIGERWLGASNEHGRRLDNPGDFVRIEIATALERNITVIPVLLNNAQMPQKHELPEVLQPLSMRNAIRIYDDQFEGSIEKLVESLTD